MANYRICAVVCTYNRADLLPLCLKALCEQSLSVDDYEILVIDNASTDNTAQVVENFMRDYPHHHLQRIYEPKQGLGYARNTGWRVAQSPYIAYIDDDAIADVDWLKFALEALESTPKPLCVTGEVGVFYTTPKPIWFKDSYEARAYGDAPRYLTQGESFAGIAVWDKDALAQYGGFATDKGVTGNFLSVGEETDLFLRIWRNTPDAVFFYTPNIHVKHHVPLLKMTVGYRFRRSFVTGQVLAQDAILKQNMTPLNRFNTIAKQSVLFVRLAWHILQRRGQYTFWQQWFAEEVTPLVQKWGLMTRMMGFRRQLKRD
jgi:glucosyl-dolichyl phosphate glucuronosyltransferase